MSAGMLYDCKGAHTLFSGQKERERERERERVRKRGRERCRICPKLLFWHILVI
jgi:hypothetical protein